MKDPKLVTYEVALPCKELSGFVSHFWHSRFNNGVRNYFSYHATANTNFELVVAFGPRSAYKRGILFANAQGHADTYNRIDAGGFSEMFGVSLYAHALPFFFKISVSELTNQLVDFSEIVKREPEVILDYLSCARDFNECVEIMSQYLKGRFDTSRNTDLIILNAIRRMREMRGQVSILNLASEYSLSQKQFVRRFKDFSGFNPKLYSRILRFESSLSDNGFTTFTEKALDLGYYDQAHFINDFKRFSGFSPGNYTPITP